MAERVTKSYADKHAEIEAKIEALKEQDKNMSAREKVFYSKAGDVLFTVLEASDLKELKKNWNNEAPDDMKVDKIECEVEMPKLDPTLVMKNPKKFEKLVKEYQKAADIQKAAAAKAISSILHVSVMGDMKNKLRELGILNDGLVDEVVDEDEEENVSSDMSLEEILHQEQEEQRMQEQDNSSYDPFGN